MFVIKFLFYFALSFVILSFPIQRKAAFYHINKLAAPYTTQLFSHLGDKIEESLNHGAKAGKRLFNNTLPEVEKDQIKSTFSSTKKAPMVESFQENYTVEEKEMLKKIFTNQVED